MKIDLSFRHDYEIKVLKGAIYDTRGPMDSPGNFLSWYGTAQKTGYLVTPRGGEPWIGVVAAGPFPSLSPMNSLFSCPNPRDFCIVLNGQALIVSTERPGKSVSVPCAPVLDVKILPEINLMLFSDYTGVVAWGPNGLEWRTCPVAFNGVEILYSDENYIYGSTLDEDGPNPYAPFQIEVKTGRTTGGCMLLDPTLAFTNVSVPLNDGSTPSLGTASDTSVLPSAVPSQNPTRLDYSPRSTIRLSAESNSR
jgi:hypothetical protein